MNFDSKPQGLRTPARLSYWPKKLDNYLLDCQDRSFKYGTFDCATFALGAAEAILGEKPETGIEPWRTTREAVERLEEYGSVVALMSWAEEIDSWTAATGDIATVLIDGTESLGVVLGARVAGPGKKGLVFLSRQNIVRAWRI